MSQKRVFTNDCEHTYIEQPHRSTDFIYMYLFLIFMIYGQCYFVYIRLCWTYHIVNICSKSLRLLVLYIFYLTIIFIRKAAWPFLVSFRLTIMQWYWSCSSVLSELVETESSQLTIVFAFKQAVVMLQFTCISRHISMTKCIYFWEC